MSIQIPDSHIELLTGPVVVGLVTIMEDGQPQASPVWVDYEDGYIYINTARGRVKDRNMSARPKVTVLAIDPTNPYRYLEVRGEVVGADESRGLEHINKMSKKYTGNADYYSRNPSAKGQETRVVYKIKPTHVVTH
ncbi:PPOX class F420-dependent oxidoreductase [Anaerolineales bacterium]